MTRKRTRFLVRLIEAIVATMAFGARGTSGAPQTAAPTATASTVTGSSSAAAPSSATPTSGARAVPTTGVYVPPSSNTSPTAARTTTTTTPWSGPPRTMAQLFDGLARSLASIDGVLHLTKNTTWEGSFTATKTTES